jgi:hypothetical protein
MKLPRMLSVVLLIVAATTGCELGAPQKIATVTGTVTDSLSGAPLKANVEVALGVCDPTCVFIGNPGTGHTDSLGRYVLQIQGPSSEKDCGAYSYFVFADAGAEFLIGRGGFVCGELTPTINFLMHAANPYTISGKLTLGTTGDPGNGFLVTVGLYGTGTSCLTTNSTCPNTSIAAVRVGVDGLYTFKFGGLKGPNECGDRDYLVTVYSFGSYAGKEVHVPCGQYNSTVNFVLQPG